MTLAASSQRSQIIRSKFRSVLQLRIHRRNQDPTSDSDPWISASGPALAPALPLVPASFLFSPGVLLPETEYCPWRSPKKESSKTSQRWSESKPRGNLTYHQYMPPEPRQGSRADPQVERSALGPQGPPLWEGTNSQQLHPRYDPHFSSLGTQKFTSHHPASNPLLMTGSSPEPLLPQDPTLQLPVLLLSDSHPQFLLSHEQKSSPMVLLPQRPRILGCHFPTFSRAPVYEDLNMPFLSLSLLNCSSLTTIARMKPTPLTPFQPGVPSPSPPPHKLELQTLKLEELTVSLGDNFPGVSFLLVGLTAASAPRKSRSLGPQFHLLEGSRSFLSRFPNVLPIPGLLPKHAQHRLSPPPPQVSELRQQLRLRGLPVSGTKSMLLERMRGGAPPRERQKPLREDGAAGAPWPRLRPKALGTSRRQGTVRAAL
ncbi:MEF2-activating motif and SAP domain-containing transcriptional regulator isoform X2 [Marmota marmota marmota]|uniref:MEF2-activating motif and SAP domain-containing transcriptional regulator isoform X2 n=1 Tax=Marmota marmota marmota TaxID=9994 RepID=UPI0020929255|nr:MEF2-activating motif and SAP domain-containing transcriptional regulator isoform X2 [Marmota marmota marmota]XP_048646549.1 MEF2-activating motif and SAP domain-containing transcriptional regulator isoform X2 [Marmota marmota marmota]